MDGSAAWSIVPIAPSATRTRSARALRKRSERLLNVLDLVTRGNRPEVYRRVMGPADPDSVVWSLQWTTNTLMEAHGDPARGRDRASRPDHDCCLRGMERRG